MSAFFTILHHRMALREVSLSLTARQVLAAGMLILATAVSAWLAIHIPGTPVPITLQTLVVMAGAGLLGGRVSAGAQSVYVLLGGIGLPWLAGSSFGGPVLFGATGGYLIGFVLASAWIGWQLRGAAGWVRIAFTLLLGEAVLFTCGALWLAAFLHVPLGQAVQMGVLPFLPGDALKVATAAGVIRWLGPKIRKTLTA